MFGSVFHFNKINDFIEIISDMCIIELYQKRSMIMNDTLRQKYSKYGIEAFVLGIIGVIIHLPAFLSIEYFLWFELVAVTAGIAGLVLGIISRKNLKQNNSIASAGLILSILAIVGCVLSTVYLFAMISEIGNAISAYASQPW